MGILPQVLNHIPSLVSLCGSDTVLFLPESASSVMFLHSVDDLKYFTEKMDSIIVPPSIASLDIYKLISI